MTKNRFLSTAHYQPGHANRPVFIVERPAMHVHRPIVLWPYVLLALSAIIALLIVIITHH